MKISIIIPAYNAETTLGAAVESCLAQSYPSVEILIINDGSTDDTKHVAKQLESSSIRIFNLENRGASAARNFGIKRASGELLTFLDADDLLDEKKSELQYKTYLEANEPDAVVFGSWQRFYPDSRKSQVVEYPQAEFQSLELLGYLWGGNRMVHPGAWLLPQSLIKKCGLWDETLSLNDDGEFFCRVILNSSRILYCKPSLTLYRSGDLSSLSAQTTPKHIDSYYRSVLLCKNHVLALDNSSRARRICADLLQTFIYSSYPECRNLLESAKEEVRTLGGSDLKPIGGRIHSLLCRLFGWKLANILRSCALRLGYRRL
jgi:glycosyltransferase involved in cell wall biosynthesis